MKNSSSIIANTLTNIEGETNIKAPKNSDNYDLQVYYKGILLYEDSIKINSILNLNSESIPINIERYNIDLKILDKWGLPPGIDINPIIVNNDGKNQIIINSNKTSDSEFVFKNIPKADYNIFFSYKSFIIEEKIKLTDDMDLNIEFPAEYQINVITRDMRGNNYTDSKVFLTREDKRININENEHISEKIPPGEYTLEVYDDKELLFKNNIDVFSDSKFDLVTKHNSIIPLILLSIIVISSIFVIIYSYIKKNIKSILTFIPIFLVLVSILFPWWEIQGSSYNIESYSSMYLYPVSLVTKTETSQIIAGEIAYLPELFIMVINIFLIITFVGCALTAFYYCNKNKKINFLILIISALTFIISISIFIFAINELSTITVGGIIGQGEIDANIYYGGEPISLYSYWGFGFGFYIYILSIIMILLNIFYVYRLNNGEDLLWKRKKKKLNQK